MVDATASDTVPPAAGAAITCGTVLCQIDRSIALLTLNRPDKLNALDAELIACLTQWLDRIEQNDSVRVIVLTGAGDKAFSAGADIGGMAPSVRQGAPTALRDFVKPGQRLTARIENYPKPIIAAVNGLAYGGGSEIVEAAPLAIASERAQFCKAEISLGFAPPFGGSQRLPRLIGRKRALRMILTGEPISAWKARDFGMVNEVVPHERLYDEAFQLAGVLAEKSPLALAACLSSVTRGINVPIDEGLAIEANHFAQMVPTNDIKEGLSAWLDRRPPRFTGT
jgi:enoyl-CoA hydratase/carnithine racemase